MDLHHALKRNRIIGVSLIVLAIAILIFVAYINSARRHLPVIFSSREILENTWLKYKAEYLEEGTLRTLDKQQNNITTSEGQSYTMLRSVWMDDRTTFDTSFKWTQDNLKHKNDALHAWLFGARQNGSYGVLTDRGGQNSAADAESDIAVSLLFAYHRWKDVAYLNEAKAIISDIWDKEVVQVNGKPVLAADDLETNAPSTIVVNPSYFSPYAYRMFAEVDKDHNWNGVVDSSYDILERSMKAKLDMGNTAFLVPDWIRINRKTGEITAMNSGTLTTNFGYDALRTPWRLSLDWHWYGEERAKKLLDMMSFFSREWTDQGRVATVYGHDGSVVTNAEAPAVYGGLIGYFMLSDSKNAKNVYEQRLEVLYNPDTNSWKNVLGYYDDNWTWFGIGLYNNLLPNLAKGE